MNWADSLRALKNQTGFWFRFWMKMDLPFKVILATLTFGVLLIHWGMGYLYSSSNAGFEKNLLMQVATQMELPDKLDTTLVQVGGIKKNTGTSSGGAVYLLFPSNYPAEAQESLRTRLTAQGYEVSQFTDPSQALAVADGGKTCLLLARYRIGRWVISERTTTRGVASWGVVQECARRATTLSDEIEIWHNERAAKELATSADVFLHIPYTARTGRFDPLKAQDEPLPKSIIGATLTSADEVLELSIVIPKEALLIPLVLVFAFNNLLISLLPTIWIQYKDQGSFEVLRLWPQDPWILILSMCLARALHGVFWMSAAILIWMLHAQVWGLPIDFRALWFIPMIFCIALGYGALGMLGTSLFTSRLLNRLMRSIVYSITTLIFVVPTFMLEGVVKQWQRAISNGQTQEAAQAAAEILNRGVLGFGLVALVLGVLSVYLMHRLIGNADRLRLGSSK